MTVTLWRLAVATVALSGVALAAARYDVWWTALSQLASLAAGACYVGLAAYPWVTGRAEPRSAWLRGALTSTLLLVALAYLPMQNGNLTAPFSIVEHVVTPALVLVDFLLVGDDQRRLRWWHPLTWLVPPLAYLACYIGGDLAVYAALDAGRPAQLVARVGVLTGVLLACGYALCAVGYFRSIGAKTAPSRPPAE